MSQSHPLPDDVVELVSDRMVLPSEPTGVGGRVSAAACRSTASKSDSTHSGRQLSWLRSRHREPMLSRADAAYALEGGAEGEAVAVADLPGDGIEGGGGLAQQVSGQGQPPLP